jgi:pSer/pThr/pTyr-binding forkhead associated (FHA) protein
MSCHLEVSKPSGRELIPLSGQRVTLGKAATNEVSLAHDETVSRLHAVLENLGFAWSIRDMGSRNGTYLNGEKITAERVLRSGDEVRVGKSRLIFWEVRDSGEGKLDEETVTAQPIELFVTEAAVKQHLQNLYDKFAIPAEGDRRVRLANEALRRGAVTLAQLRDSSK